MATVTTPPLAATGPGPVVLRAVPWEVYCRLRDEEANRSVRMTYLDGDLILMSPEIHRDANSPILGPLVRGVTSALGLEVGSTTLRREAPRGGAGKEADAACDSGADELRMRRR